MWAEEKAQLLTYINDCIKKVLGDKKFKEETFSLFTDIEFLYGPGLPRDEIDDDYSENERNKFIDYSNRDISKGKEREFKEILKRCSTIKRMLGLIPSDIIKDEINALRKIEYEKEINSLVIYASLLLASYHSNMSRTLKSTKTKRDNRASLKHQVWQAYIHVINDLKTARLKKLLTEHSAAKIIQEKLGVKKDGKTPKIGLTLIKTLLKEEFSERNATPPWIK